MGKFAMCDCCTMLSIIGLLLPTSLEKISMVKARPWFYFNFSSVNCLMCLTECCAEMSKLQTTYDLNC